MNAAAPRRHQSMTVAITSGKGGVGKTNVVINLAVSLARLRHRVAIVDGDFGLGNVDVLLGLAPTQHLGSVLAGEATVEEVIVNGPSGLKVVPSGSGIRSLTSLTPEQWDRLRDALDNLAEQNDFVIVDTASGVSDNVIDLLGLADRVLVVTAVEPTAVVDAYAVIKLLSVAYPMREIGLLVNNARNATDAELIFAQLEVATQRFLHRRLTSYGFVLHDTSIHEAVVAQRSLVDHLPQSPASRCFRILAVRLTGSAANGQSGLRLVPRATKKSDSEAPQCV